MTKPTKLEEEIEEAIYKHDRETNKRLTNADIAKAAAEAAKRYIEKAYNDAYYNGLAAGVHAEKTKDYNYIGSATQANNWKTENGIE